MKTKLFVPFCSSFVLSIVTLFTINMARVYAATITWDGGGSTDNMTEAANWSGDVAPVAGDDLVFPVLVGVDEVVANDFTADTSFNSIVLSGTVDNFESYTINGNAMTIVAGISITTAGSTSASLYINTPLTLDTTQTLSTSNGGLIVITSVVSGAGALVKDGDGTLRLSGANTFTGTLTVNNGEVYVRSISALGAASSGTIINAGGGLVVSLPEADKTGTISEPLTFNTDLYGSNGVLYSDSECGFSPCSGTNITYSGAITLGSNVKISSSSTTTITGPITGSYTIEMKSGTSGTLVLNSSSNGSLSPNGTTEAPATTTMYSSNSPSTSINVGTNETAIIESTGVYGTTSVGDKGKLKGTGAVGALSVYTGGTLAPGLSPGCLASGNLTLTGTFEIEIAGTTVCTEYDQQIVTGTVDVTGATLIVTFLNGFTGVSGNTYTIINNDLADAVIGEFAGAADGATITLGGAQFVIDYQGGDGNDVVLTQQTPGVPNTGFQHFVLNNPVVMLAITFAVTITLGFAARKTH